MLLGQYMVYIALKTEGNIEKTKSYQLELKLTI